MSEGTLNCTNRDSESHNHAMDLGVVCGPPLEDECKYKLWSSVICPTVSPHDILFIVSCSMSGESFRLTNGSTNREGRVEVCVDGRWGTVCNNSREGIAGAVCSQLQLPSTGMNFSYPT